MKTATDLETVMIAAVRADGEVGRGTCSSIDECFDNDELLELLRRRQANDPAGAVRVAREHEKLHRMAAADVKAEAF